MTITRLKLYQYKISTYSRSKSSRKLEKKISKISRFIQFKKIEKDSKKIQEPF